MTTPESDLLNAFEVHDPSAIRKILDGGLDPTRPIRDKLPIDWLTEMYYRSERFPECVQILLERGALARDPKIVPVLLNRADLLADAIRADPSLLLHRTDMVSAFTPLIGATLLHVAAEFCLLDVAKLLIDRGADPNAVAATDPHGSDGHTPIFHTVNSLKNRGQSVMKLLLGAGAKVDIRLPSLVWGRGFEWETTFFDVTPISFAQMGLLPQVTRSESDVYQNIALMLESSRRACPPLPNVPNKYLLPRRK